MLRNPKINFQLNQLKKKPNLCQDVLLLMPCTLLKIIDLVIIEVHRFYIPDNFVIR
jgi:hypothetical protein